MVLTTIALVGLLLVAQSAPPNAAGPDPGAALARTIPAEGLVLYVEYDGLAAHANGWRETAAYGMLNRTKAGAMMAEVSAQFLEKFPGRLQNLPSGPELVRVFERVAQHGFVLAGFESGDTILVLRDAGTPEVRPPIERLLSAPALRPGETLPPPTQIRGRSIVVLRSDAPVPPPAGSPDAVRTALLLSPPGDPDGVLAWWSEGTDFILADLSDRHQVDHVLDALDGKCPSAATHPDRVALVAGRGIDQFEPTGLFFITSIQKMFGPPADPIARDESPPDKPPAGSTTDRISGRWGFHGPALLTDVRIEVPSPRKGPATLLNQPPLQMARLVPFPADVRGVGAGSLDVSAAFDPLRELLRVLSLETPDASSAEVEYVKFYGRKAYSAMIEGERALRDATGLRLREDLLARLGKTWRLLTLPPEAGAGHSRAAAVPVIVGDVNDAAAFDRALRTLVSWFNRSMNAAAAAEVAPGGPDYQLEALPGEDHGYVLKARPGLSFAMDHGLSPTILLGRRHVALATSPGKARKALRLAEQDTGRWLPQGELKRALENLPPNVVF